MARTAKQLQHRYGDPAPGVLHEYVTKINGRNVVEDTELKVKGRRGVVRFIRRVTTPTSSWIDVFTPEGQFSSVLESDVVTVKTTRTARPKKAA